MTSPIARLHHLAGKQAFYKIFAAARMEFSSARVGLAVFFTPKK